MTTDKHWMEQQPDGEIKVCMKEDGITACTFVSSMHLVYDKQPQLKEAIKRQAAAACDMTT